MNVIIFVTACVAIVDLIFVVDASGSIQEADPQGWTRVKSFIKDVVRRFAIGPSQTRVGLTIYSEKAVRQRQDPDVPAGSVGFFLLDTYSDLPSLEAAIDALFYFGSFTNTQEGLQVARQNILQPSGDRPNVQNLVIVLTDGKSNLNEQQLPREAQLLKDRATVISVGVTDQVDINELSLIASAPNLVVLADDFRALETELDRIVSTVCTAVTTPRPPPVTQAPQPPGKECFLEIKMQAVLNNIKSCPGNYFPFLLFWIYTPAQKKWF